MFLVQDNSSTAVDELSFEIGEDGTGGSGDGNVKLKLISRIV